MWINSETSVLSSTTVFFSFISASMDEKKELYEFVYSSGYKKSIDYSDSEEEP